MNNLNFNNIS